MKAVSLGAEKALCLGVQKAYCLGVEKAALMVGNLVLEKACCWVAEMALPMVSR